MDALIGPGAAGADDVVVLSPGVGLWQPAIGAGQLVRPGDRLGWLVVLGVEHEVRAPDGAYGVAVTAAGRGPLEHGARLFDLDPVHAIGGAAEAPAPQRAATEGLVFAAPTSGRFYSRPGLGKPAFVAAGDVIAEGQTVCLLEVMKTFNRVVYAAEGGLPERARVVEVVAADEADVEAGEVLLRLEAP